MEKVMRKNRIAAVVLSAALMLGSYPAGVWALESVETETKTETNAETETEADAGKFGVLKDHQVTVTEQDTGDTGNIGETEYSGETADTEQNGVSIAERSVPWYIRDLGTTFDMPVFFLNGAEDLPYVNLTDWADVMVTLYRMNADENYALEFEADGNVAMYTRENGYSMLFDFAEGTFTFDDYDAFVHSSSDTALLDMVSMDIYNDKGEQLVLERVDKGSFDRYGKEIEVNLTNYDITVSWSAEDGLYLVPLQTMGDFLTAQPLMLNTFFNGDAVYIATPDDMGAGFDEPTELGESYFGAPFAQMSENLAWYNYCELCLALDYHYGLKEIHDITSFDSVFRETGYKEGLSSTDPDVADGALMDFIDYYLDDLHSGFRFASFRADDLISVGGAGLSSRQDEVNREIFSSAREAADKEITTYQEVGNTAYITFDGFQLRNDPSVYYEFGTDPEMETDPSSDMVDTIALMIDAHEQITRENSPIENVVIDLSLNGGGELDACAFVAAWVLGEASMSIRSSMTGAVSTSCYRADVNLDGKFDEKDNILDKNLYCLISPYSFSCGNLLPNVLKSSNRVTLLGQTSGGGSCSVLPMTTANGTMFQISSPYRMSYAKNGSYYDIDLGVEPDYHISRPANFYDREALTEYINNLF